MVYRDFKDWTRKTASDKILRDKAFNLVKNPKYDGIKEVLLQFFINSLIKKTFGSSIKNEKKSD